MSDGRPCLPEQLQLSIGQVTTMSQHRLVCEKVVSVVDICVGVVVWEQLLHQIHLLLCLTDVTLDVQVVVLGDLSQVAQQSGGAGWGEARGHHWPHKGVLPQTKQKYTQ